MAGEDRRARLSGLTRALLFSPIVLLVASATRLLIVCNYDAQSAATVAATGGLTGTLLGTTIPLLPAFLPAVVLFLLVARRWVLVSVMAAMTALISPAYSTVDDAWEDADASVSQFWRWLSGGGNVPFGVAIEDPIGVQYAAGVAAVAFVVTMWSPPGWTFPSGYSLRSEPSGRQFLRWSARWVVYPVLLFVLCGYSTLLLRELYRVPADWGTLSDILHRPWIPAEEVRPKDGTHVVGYTIGTKDGWHVFLREDDRTIDHMPTASVTDRQVCALDGLQNLQPMPLVQMAGVRRHSLPGCQE